MPKEIKQGEEDGAEKSNEKQAYQNIVRGKLKLKGASSSEKKGKKKRKREEEPPEQQQVIIPPDEELGLYIEKTEYEEKFEEQRKKKQAQEIKKLASKSYRQRLDEFNKKIASLSEHHDIPKVGPG